MNIIWIILIGIIGIVLFSIIMRYIESLPKKRLEVRKKKEKWGELIAPEPEIYWDLGREVITNHKRLDSRPYLEGLGFKFLGYADEKMLGPNHLLVGPKNTMDIYTPRFLTKQANIGLRISIRMTL